MVVSYDFGLFVSMFVCLSVCYLALSLRLSVGHSGLHGGDGRQRSACIAYLQGWCWVDWGSPTH